MEAETQTDELSEQAENQMQTAELVDIHDDAHSDQQTDHEYDEDERQRQFKQTLLQLKIVRSMKEAQLFLESHSDSESEDELI